MGFGSLWHWAIVLIVVLILFGRGRISEIMGDFGKGVRGFKEGLAENDTGSPALPSQAIPETDAKRATERPGEPAQ